MQTRSVVYRRLVSEDETSMLPVSSATRALMRATRDSMATGRLAMASD